MNCIRGEESLWRMVVLQAVLDALINKTGTSYFHEYEQYQAETFFEQKSGGWAKMRREVCDLAGICESKAVQKYYQIKNMPDRRRFIERVREWMRTNRGKPLDKIPALQQFLEDTSL